MSNMTKTMAVFAGSTCPELAEDIATALGTTLGNVKLEKFSNGEIYARYLESVRGADVFIVQSTSTPNVNEAVMELLIMADAAKRASARTVNAVVPCYGYARQDRKAAAREPITAKLVANIMTAAGIDRTITIDLHQGQIQLLRYPGRSPYGSANFCRLLPQEEHRHRKALRCKPRRWPR